MSCLLNGMAPLHHMCKAKEAEKTQVALMMVGVKIWVYSE
jgi:hypothetical protein